MISIDTPVVIELDWYNAIQPFSNFNELTQDRHYHRVPTDWHIIIADVADSTLAIMEGRYKDVNTIGAACIIAAQNALNRTPFPYVFGGDGATLVIPPSQLAHILSTLESVADLALKSFGMTLRIGAVRISEVTQMGSELEVAKHQLAGMQTIAIFRGGAITKAEEIVKNNGAAKSHSQTLAPTEKDSLNLDGLSCRWQPIPSINGRIATLMVRACGNKPKLIYSLVLNQLDTILSGNAYSSLPVHEQIMSYKGIGQLLTDEKWHTNYNSKKNYFWRTLEILIAVAIFKWQISVPFFRPMEYKSSLGAHSDYRKFDDTLRMVLDVTPNQLTTMRKMLDVLHSEGEIIYGLHESDTALMTCFVYGINKGEHIHFIDGSDGGYTLSARQLKTQASSKNI